MPLPDRMARLNRYVANPVIRSFAGRIPPFAVVLHRGRTSGQTYRTPVIAFRTGDGFAIALTYGAGRDWVKNVLAAGGCTLISGGREVRLARPRIDEGRAGLASIPSAVRAVLGVLRVNKVLRLTAV